MITRATPDDIPHIVRLGRANYAAMNDDDAYDSAAAERFLRDVIFAHGAAFISRGGMIGGILSPRWCAPTVTEAVELFWFAQDGSGARLLEAWVSYAERSGAQPVISSRKLPKRLAGALNMRASETIWRGANVH